MKKINAIIIDDEPLAHRIIERFVVDIPFLEVVGQCYFATDAYALLNEHDLDLIFLDIEMPKLKGLDFLKSLVKKPQVILTTAYEEYALEGFNLQVTDYLLKPFSFDRFLQAVNKVYAAIDLKPNSQTPKTQTIFIKVDKKQIQVEVNNIQCLESYGNYVKVWLEDEMLLTPKTLSSFETELQSMGFERVHKSFLVQRKYVSYVEGHMVFLQNRMEVPVGKNHRTQVKNWYA